VSNLFETESLILLDSAPQFSPRPLPPKPKIKPFGQHDKTPAQTPNPSYPDMRIRGRPHRPRFTK